MPEGDTIYRTANSLRYWICNQKVTNVSGGYKNPNGKFGDFSLLRDCVVEKIESRAKHLLIIFSNNLVLHTHMKMTGSWHVYQTGVKWKLPAKYAKVVITCGSRQAVCFSAPVVELFEATSINKHVVLSQLGPDILDDISVDFNSEKAFERLHFISGETLVAELLLSQQVISGIGNIYRCESLFLSKVNPWLKIKQINKHIIKNLYEVSAILMRQNLTTKSRNMSYKNNILPGGATWVYGREQKLCRICTKPIRRDLIGMHQRSLYWCEFCQK